MDRRKKMDSGRRNLTHWRRGIFRRRRMHDPMLVLNMSIFTVGNGWDRTFNPLKAHENGTR
jgi:hypothetical protein